METSCLGRWRAENDRVISRWKEAQHADLDCALQRAARQSHLALSRLLCEIQGLPATVPVLPLEITVLYNALVLGAALAGGFTQDHSDGIRIGLRRVLEARGESSGGDPQQLWQAVLRDRPPPEPFLPLHRLAGLQGALWLAADHPEKAADLIGRLSPGQKAEPPPGDRATRGRSDTGRLLVPLARWEPPREDPQAALAVQGAQELRDVLLTAATFRHGLQELEAENQAEALTALQEAAAGPCSRGVLAKIHTALSCCHQRLGRPQTALQLLLQALQADPRGEAPLYQAAALYRQWGRTSAELETLELLAEVLSVPDDRRSSALLRCLICVELLVPGPRPNSPLQTTSQSEVKCLLARRYLRTRRVEEASEHYLDLLALWQEGSQQQVSLPSGSLLPEVFLEAAAALVEAGRAQDSLTVCEELLRHVEDRLPAVLRLETAESVPEDAKDRLSCLLWAGAAHLFQGQAWIGLGDWKQAVSHFTQSLSFLFRVQLSNGDGISRLEESPPEVEVLRRLQGAALIGRGTQQLVNGREAQALQDFLLGAQVCPGCRDPALHLVRALWKLNRRPEAVAHWRELESPSAELDGDSQRAAERRLPLYLVSCLSWSRFPSEEPLLGELRAYVRQAAGH
ncbi:Fanconi anemia group G protein [Ornithorhynchus anatinus]|uniref:FA complementation group G n=1 Tax=Ornithorhynchus anatinus TaxID=9258 RepID=A0A6I8PFW5_ORNAN|nr:Fanconi anemia group G protein [Ornithorhynchus anatinus]